MLCHEFTYSLNPMCRPLSNINFSFMVSVGHIQGLWNVILVLVDNMTGCRSLLQLGSKECLKQHMNIAALK